MVLDFRFGKPLKSRFSIVEIFGLNFLQNKAGYISNFFFKQSRKTVFKKYKEMKKIKRYQVSKKLKNNVF